MQRGKRKTMQLMFTIRKHSDFFFWKSAQLSWFLIQRQNRGSSVLWPVPPVHQRDDWRSWSLPWGWAHFNNDAFLIGALHLGWRNWLYILMECWGTSYLYHSVEKDGHGKTQNSRFHGVRFSLVGVSGKLCLYIWWRLIILTFWQLASICSPNSTEFFFWRVTSFLMPQSSKAGNQVPCLPLAKGEVCESNRANSTLHLLGFKS